MERRPEQDREEIIEARLRASAPPLPPELRQQVLRRCRQERRNKPACAWQGQWRLAGALTSLALFCWIASGCLDARSQAMIAGENGGQSGSTLAFRANSLSPGEADSQNFGIALRWRMSQLALLLHEKHSG